MIKAVIFDFYGVVFGARGLDADVLTIMRALRKAGFKVALLSNSSIHLHNELKQLQVHQDFDLVLTSEETGLFKPDPQIYLHATGKLGIEPSEAVFVDDTLGRVQGAQHAGLIGILYANASELKSQLKKIGVSLG